MSVKRIKSRKQRNEIGTGIVLGLDEIWEMRGALQNVLVTSGKDLPPGVSIKLARIGKVLYDEIELIDKERMKMLHTYIDALWESGALEKPEEPEEGERKQDPYLSVKLNSAEESDFSKNIFSKWMKEEPRCKVGHNKIKLTKEDEATMPLKPADMMFLLPLFV